LLGCNLSMKGERAS